jgi:hypothetical protein
MAAKREWFNVSEKEIGDYTGKGPWIVNDETYTFVDEIRVNGDGEWYGIVVKRESDGKLFQFDWGYSGGNYYYEPEWVEVKQKVVTTNTYIWED